MKSKIIGKINRKILYYNNWAIISVIMYNYRNINVIQKLDNLDSRDNIVHKTCLILLMVIFCCLGDVA